MFLVMMFITGNYIKLQSAKWFSVYSAIIANVIFVVKERLYNKYAMIRLMYLMIYLGADYVTFYEVDHNSSINFQTFSVRMKTVINILH